MADEYISVLIKKLLYLVWVPHISLEGKCKVQRSMREINGGITPALHIYIPNFVYMYPQDLEKQKKHTGIFPGKQMEHLWFWDISRDEHPIL